MEIENTFEEFCEKHLELGDAWDDLRARYKIITSKEKQLAKLAELDEQLKEAKELIEKIYTIEVSGKYPDKYFDAYIDIMTAIDGYKKEN